MDKKTAHILLIIIFALGLILRVAGVWSQPALDDEVQAASTAIHYVENGQFGLTMWNHPPLKNIMLYISTKALGFGGLGLRVPSLIYSSISILLLFLLIRELLNDNTAAIIGAGLLAFDQVSITFARQCLQEPSNQFFTLLGVWLVIRYLKGLKPLDLVLAGVTFGIGAAGKFHVLPPMFMLLGVCLFYAYKRRSLLEGIFVLLCLSLLPLALYMLSYLPVFLRGYDLAEWVLIQKTMMTKIVTHGGNPNEILSDAWPWQWFLRPMGYANFVPFEGGLYLVIAISNPVVWMAVLPSFGYLLVRALKTQDAAFKWSLWMLFLLFLANYLPLATATRPIFILSSLSTIPFAIALVSATLSELSVTFGRKAVAAYLALALCVALFLYPLAIGKGLQYKLYAPISEHFTPHQPGSGH